MKDRVIAELFAKAAGQCSICRTPLFQESVKIGEMAHVIGRKKSAARGREPFEGDIDSYENLILLCPNHHTIVDGNPEEYPVGRLRDIKRNHESRISQLTAETSQRPEELYALQQLMRFLPFARLEGALHDLPNRVRTSFLDAATAIEAFPFDFPHCRPFNDVVLEEKYQSFCDGVDAVWDVVTRKKFGPPEYDNDQSGDLRISRNLSWVERQNVIDAVDHAKWQLWPAYRNLMAYIREAYPEVNLNAARLT